MGIIRTQREPFTRPYRSRSSGRVVLLSTGLSALTALIGCGDYSAQPVGSGGFEPPATAGPCGVEGCAGAPATATVIRRHVPTDERPAVTPARRPPPISGGTLLASRDGNLAVVADPDRDRVVLVNLKTQTVEKTLTLEAGAEPGRVIEDANGQFHVVLRGAGSVLTIDRQTASPLLTRKVCAEPRSVAIHPTAQTLLVACAEGILVEQELYGVNKLRTVALGADLRDVLVAGTTVYVSRFRSAELLTLNADLSVVATRRPRSLTQQVQRETTVATVMSEPAIAWRAIPSGNNVFVLHQRATTDIIQVTPVGEAGDPAAPDASAYGGPGGVPCNGIVQTGISAMGPEGAVRSSVQIPAVLGVDVAVSATGEFVAIAQAGNGDPEAPFATTVLESPTNGSEGPPLKGEISVHATGVVVMASGELYLDPTACGGTLAFVTQQPVISVAFAGGTRLLAQTREPSQLLVTEVPGSWVSTIELSGDSVKDTGHDVFHRNAGAGIACASCHPEGGEDGRVWNFSTTGPRRTQSLHIGLEGTAPFHWEGDLPDFSSLMGEVFVRRMGGVFQSPARLEALSSYLFSLKAPTPTRSAADQAALRGQLLFQSAATGCATCHSGPKLTNNETVDIGKGVPLQVPSLLGLSRRAPYMHDGCAPSLQARFTPECGGTNHGDISSLSPAGLSDLLAYLEAL